MASGKTSRLSIPYPLNSDPPNVPGDVQALATLLDGEVVVYLTPGLLSARPAAGTAGRIYEATDTSPATFYYDDGTQWTAMGPTGIVSAKGDLLVASASGVLTRLPVAANGTVLRSRSAATNGVAYETLTIRQGHTWAVQGAPTVTSGDENPYPGFQVSVPSGASLSLSAVVGAAPGASGAPTYKLRRYTSGAWGDIAGFGTTGSPLSMSTGTGTGTVTTPTAVPLVDGDVIGLWIVGAGTSVAAFRVTVQMDYNPA